MALREVELLEVCAELGRALAHAPLQKLHALAPAAVALTLRAPSETHVLLLRAGGPFGRLSALDAVPKERPAPSPFQAQARRLLEGARLEGAQVAERGTCLVLRFEGREGEALLLARFAGAGALAVVQGGVVRALDAPKGHAPQDLRPGTSFVPPVEVAAAVAGESRLVPGDGPLPLLRAAEALLGGQERAAAQRDARQPLVRRLERLARTREKVRAEASREAEAQAHRRDGELLKRNPNAAPRGARSVVLPDYLPDGTVEQRTVALDPARPWGEQAERHFHQYRRLVRGMALATQRLAVLDAEEAALRAELAAAGQGGEGAAFRVPPPVGHAAAQGPQAPYRSYRGAGGALIKVGKGAAKNDALTFHHAEASDVWLHARGVPGAHVVVPLPKGAELPQELLLDAAHLALHHSELKGEPRGEVSWTYAKYVRKPKGAAPGAVRYTHEKTFWLRVEPERLQRLLASEQV